MPPHASLSIADAAERFVATVWKSSPGTQRTYRQTLVKVARHVGADRPVAAVRDVELAAAVTALWSTSAPTTYRQRQAAVRSWMSWCSTHTGNLRTAVEAEGRS